MCGHFFDHGVGRVLAKVLPIAAAFIPGVGPLASAALTAGAGALSSRLQGGSWGDALKAGAMSGLGSAIAPIAGNTFASSFPETAASFGVTGGSPTVLSSLGMSGSMAGPEWMAQAAGSGLGQAAMNNMGAGSSGLSQAALDNVNQTVGVNTMNDAAMGTSANLNEIAGNIAPPSGGGLSNIPVIGPLLSRSADWASKNPIPLALGALTAYSGLRQDTTNRKQQDAHQAQLDAKNAQDLANWRLTLNQPPLPRTLNPSLAGFDYTKYGYGPEQQFFINNQTRPNAMKKGGRVMADDDGEPDMEPYGGSRVKVQPMTDGEPDMEPVGKAKGGSVKKLRTKARRLSDGGRTFPRKNGKISGPGGGLDDKVPAMLSNGEYVIPADVVAHFGDGSNDAGADALDHIIAHVRSQKTGSKKQPTTLSKLNLPEEIS